LLALGDAPGVEVHAVRQIEPREETATEARERPHEVLFGHRGDAADDQLAYGAQVDVDVVETELDLLAVGLQALPVFAVEQGSELRERPAQPAARIVGTVP